MNSPLRLLRLTHARSLIKFLARVWLTSWSAVVRVHGVKPKRQPNQIFVANHSTIFDVALFMQDSCCAVVGQAQKGALGFIQTKWLSCLGCIWFNRSESKDREMVRSVHFLPFPLTPFVSFSQLLLLIFRMKGMQWNA